MRTWSVFFLFVAAASALPFEKKRDIEDWVKAALITENQLKNVDPAEVKKVADNLREDMNEIGEDLDALLKEGVDGKATERVEEHLGNLLFLVEMHAEHGAESIKPEKIELPKSCSPENFREDCKENFERVVSCLKEAVDRVKATFDDSETSVIGKIKKVKGIVGLVARAMDPIHELVETCGFKKKRDFEEWQEGALVGKDDLKNINPAELEKVGKNMRNDLDGIGHDLDLLEEGINGLEAESVEEHLAKTVELAKLHEKMAANSIPPEDIEIPEGCREEDFGMDCDENFKRVVGCLKRAVKHMKEVIDNDDTVVEKVSHLKGVVGLIAKATGPIKELHEACTPKRSLFRFFE
ncbi:uncharacterized protein LOC133173086 [Saccostrea echinata]|uniref:uncharacterized protein LOC133173086 n=1 Tax=Saccostrea echinata TaxID=191078 RepID=UPI002A7FBBD6|nr:uncharacterized protein LOC133173086 [Saccostrea echinata]